MHKKVEEARLFVQHFLAEFHPQGAMKVGLAVPFMAIQPLVDEIRERSLLIGAQNMNDASEGAFTGEIAGSMLKEAGAQFVLLGHSERRRLFSEGDAFIHRKVKQAVEVGLQPILCVGETREDREAGETQVVLERQLTEGLGDIPVEDLQHLVIAYEPVWAIGQEHSATPQVAQEAHHFCRRILAGIVGEERAERCIVQYGGSVSASNARALLAQPDIDGLLIGRASLFLESFLQIVNDEYPKLRFEIPSAG